MDIQFYLQQSVQDIIQVGLMIVGSSSCKILYVNHRLTKMLGYSREDLLNMKVFDLLYNGENPDIWKRKTDSNVVKFKTKNASALWVLMSSQPIVFNKDKKPGIFYSITDITRRKIAEDRLQKSQKKLKYLNMRLMNAQEEERKRISVELHDGISSNLTALRLILEQKLAETDLPVQEVNTIIEMLRTIAKDTRRISRNLHPSVLEDIGLVAGFTSVIREFKSIHPDIVINPKITLDEKKIDSRTKLALYRILQESLSNIFNHSHADTVDIGCEISGNHIVLDIFDNGQGFDVDNIVNSDHNELKGMGLSSLQQRTEHCNGTFSIASSPGNGTRIAIKIPV